MDGGRDYRQSHRTESKAAEYDREFSNGGTTSAVLWRIEQQLLRPWLNAHQRELHRVLDFACGTGRILSMVSEYADETVGVDISSEMLAIAAQRCPHAKLVAADITRDASELTGQFDLVTAFRFFLEAQNELRHDALAALRPLITKTGYLVANFHRNPQSLRGLYLKMKGRRTGRDYRMISFNEAQSLLAFHGFRITKFWGYAHLLYGSRQRAESRLRLAIDTKLARLPGAAKFGTSFLVVAQRI